MPKGLLMSRYVAVALLVSCAIVARMDAWQSAPALDPCTLVSVADVEAIVGKLKGAPRSETNERARSCSFAFAGSDEMEMWVYPVDGLDRARRLYKDLIAVTDVGAEAYMRRNPSIEWLELYARKGTVSIQVTMKSAPGDTDKVKALARKALEKL
jgi:hypothetical protein